MEDNQFSTIMTLDYTDKKKELTIRSKYKTFVEETRHEVTDELNDKSIMRFLNLDINNIKYNKNTIEITNVHNCKLIINFRDNEHTTILNYLEEHRSRLLEITLFNYILNNNFFELRFDINREHPSDSQIELLQENNKKILVYKAPYKIDKKNKVIVDEKDFELVKKSIMYFLQLNESILKGTNFSMTSNDIYVFSLITSKTIIYLYKEIYEGLDTYMSVLMREIEEYYVKKDKEIERRSEQNKMKSKLKLIKNDFNNQGNN